MFEAKGGFFKRLDEKLQCPIDEDADYENTYWCNRDLIPIPPSRRTWTWQGYAGYWVITGVNTTAWTAGSSLLALGLSVSQAMGVIVGASLVSSCLAVVAGWMGSHHYLGFTVLSRASWGMFGGFWPVLNRIMTACIWMGIQLYWGGQAMQIILGAIIGPKFIFLKNTLPESAHVETVSLISFFIFVILFLPILMIRPEHLQMPLRISFIMICGTVIGMMIWALAAAGGAGTLINQGPTMHGSTLRWNTLYGLQSIIGGYGSGILGQSDWTRYSSRPRSALFGQLITAPLTISLTALCGLLITSATAKLYGGEYQWNPFVLLLFIQQQPHFSSSASARAGTFFAGLGLLFSQLALCIVLNGMSCGMDLAALCSRYINIRRGTYICTAIAIAICPWQYVTRATVFITVLSGWSVFLSPMTGILLSDYFIVRRCQLRVADLYLGVDRDGAYWYTLGMNWRAFISWTMGLWPLLPGFVRQIKRSEEPTAWAAVPFNGWERVYDTSYFFGVIVAGGLYATLTMVFRPKNMRGDEPFEMKKTEHDLWKAGVLAQEQEVGEARAIHV